MKNAMKIQNKRKLGSESDVLAFVIFGWCLENNIDAEMTFSMGVWQP